MSLVDYRKSLERRKLRQQSVFVYMNNLKLAEKFLGKPLAQASKEDVQRFLDSIVDRKANTISIRLRSLKLYFKWLGKPEIAAFPLPKIHNNNLVSSDMLSEEEILRMIESCDNLRDKALISILFDSACRKSEIMNLNVGDVVIETNKTGYIVVDGKTGKRQIPLSFSIPALKNWINTHPNNNHDSPLFIGSKRHLTKRISAGGVRRIIQKVSKRAGISKRIYPHLFRHTRLTDLDRKGLSHTAMKHYAGWSRNSQMPSVYSHFSQSDTKELIYQADGIVKTKRKRTILEPVICVKCSTPNDKTNRFCYLCGMPLDENSMKEFEVSELLKQLIISNPELSKIIAEKIRSLK